MLVDHLRNGVAEQHDVLVKRIDVPLQLDAVDEVDRDWHMLLAKQVQERVLQKLAFVAHGELLKKLRLENRGDRILSSIITLL